MAARKTSTKPTRIWKFAARLESERDALDILATANRYYNALVAIERDRHAAYLRIRESYAPELAVLEAQWLALDDQIEELLRATKTERQKHWQETGGEKRRVMPADVQTQLDALKAEQKRVSAEAKPLRTAFRALTEPAREEHKRRATERADGGGPRTKSKANADVLAEMLDESAWHPAWKDIARSDDVAHERALAARASCGLSTGTYLVAEEAFARAKKDSLPRAPRFRAFRHGGKLAVQTRDLTWADALSGSTALSVAPAPRRENRKGDQSRMVIVHLDQSVPRGERRKLAATVKLHRQPPDDAAIKWASFVVRRVGRRLLCEFQLTLEHESFAEPKRPAGLRAPEHVRIGWARVDGGVRVAHWPGGDVVVPDAILAQSEHADAIKSAADQHFDRIKRVLQRWMRGGPHDLTAWHRVRNDRARAMLRDACEAYARWSLGDERLRALWREWVSERRARGEDLHAPACIARRWLRARGIDGQDAHAGWLVYTWARKDAHLLQYAADSRRRAENRREEFFRSAAIRIATEFSEVTVDDYKIASLKVLPSLTLPGDVPRDQAQHNAQAAAPGRFRELLREVMGPRCTPCERPGDGTKAGTARKRKASEIAQEGGASSDAVVDAAE